jgi:hypothetical protein
MAAGGVVADRQAREAPAQGGHVHGREAVRAALAGSRPGCCGAAPRARRPRLLRVPARPRPCLGSELVCHRQLRLVPPLRVVELALDAVGAFLT